MNIFFNHFWTSILLSITLCAAAFCNDPTLLEKPLYPSYERPSFYYVKIGSWGAFYPEPLIPFDPTLSVGLRKCYNQHGYDCSIGASPHILIYGQFSYLFYPGKTAGEYLGIGLTAELVHVGKLLGDYGIIPFINIPLTLGYQFKSSTPQFCEIQITPLSSMTISYAWGLPVSKKKSSRTNSSSQRSNP